MKLLADNNIKLIQPDKNELNYQEWIHYCQQADGIINVGKNKFDKHFFEQCPQIKAISLFSVGYNHVDIQEATARKIAIGNTPDVLSKATSDTAFLLMQSVARRASFNFDRVKKGNWELMLNPMANLGQELYGKTVGIYGLGRIGYEFAKKCKYAFDMNIIYHNRSRNEAAEKELGAIYVPFEQLIKDADILSIHANYTDNQKELFNASIFKQMKSNSIFINTARGEFHNEEDLYTAVSEQLIWGVGLDVTYPEPMLPTSKLLNLPTVCVLPHIGSATIEARNGMAQLAAENIIAFVQGDKMPHLVNNEIYTL